MGRPPVGIVIWENSAGEGESPAWSGFMTKHGLYARSEDWSLGDPGNSHSRAASGTPCDFRRSACLFPPQAAAGSGPRLGAWGDRSRARPVGPKPSAPSGRRSEAERRELQGAPPAVRLCRLPGSMKRGGASGNGKERLRDYSVSRPEIPQRLYIAKRSKKKAVRERSEP